MFFASLAARLSRVRWVAVGGRGADVRLSTLSPDTSHTSHVITTQQTNDCLSGYFDGHLIAVILPERSAAVR